MYEKNGKTISFEEAGKSAEAMGMDLATWAQEFGWTESTGKTTGLSEETPAVSLQNGGSYLGNSLSELPEDSAVAKALKKLGDINTQEDYQALVNNIDEPIYTPITKSVSVGGMFTQQQETGEFETSFVYDPFKKQAEEIIKNSGGVANEKTISEKAKQLYLREAKRNLYDEKAEEILEDFDDEIYTPLGRLKKYTAATVPGFIDEGLIKRTVLQSEVIASADRSVSELDRLSQSKLAQEAYLETIGNRLNQIQSKSEIDPQSVTSDEVEEFNNLLQSYNNVTETYKNTTEQLVEVYDTAENLQQLIDLTGRSYDNLDVAVGRIGAAVLNTAGGLLNFVAELDPRSIAAKITGEETTGYIPLYIPGQIDPQLLKAGAEELSKAAEDITASVEKRQELGKVKNVEDFLEFGLDLFTEQAVNTAVTASIPGAGLMLISGSAAGQKFRDMSIEIDNGEKISALQFYGAGLLYGVGEYVTEKIALDQFLGAKRAIKRSIDLEKVAEIGLDEMTTGKAFAKYFGGVNKEGSAEAGSQFISNFADRVILGDKSVGMFDGLGESYLSGAIMSGLGFQVPSVLADVYYAASTGNEINAANERSARIVELNKKINNIHLNSDMNTTEAQEAASSLQQEVDNLLMQNIKSMKAAEARVDELSDSDKKVLLTVDSRSYKVKAAIDRINKNPNLSAKEKAQLIKKHTIELGKLMDKKDSVLMNFERSSGFSKAKVLQMQLVAESDDLNFDIIREKDSKEAISQAIKKVKDSNLSEEDKAKLVAKIESASNAKDANGNNADVNGFYVGAEEGLPLAIFTETGERNNASVAAHETSHATIFEKLFKGNADGIGLAKDLRTYTERTFGKLARDKFAKIDKLYGKLEDAKTNKEKQGIAQEIMVAAMELDRAKDLTSDAHKTLHGKLFSRFSKMIGKDMPTEIKTGKDVFLAIQSYNNSFDSGDIQGLFGKIVKGDVKARQAKTEQDTADILQSRSLSQEKTAEVADLIKKRNERKTQAEEVAKKFGVEPQADAVQQRIETKVREALAPLVGKIVTSRTKALYDPIAADAKKGVSREDFQNSLRTEIEALAFEEFDASKQDIEKFLVNRAFLRANNLAKRLGIESAEQGVKQDVETAKGITTETESKTQAEEKPKYTSLTDSKTISAETANKIKDKLKVVVRTQGARMDLSEGKNVSVKKYIKNIRDGIGNIAWDIIRQDNMYSENAKGKISLDQAKVRNFLSSKGLFIAQNLTTTTLQVKMPQLVQKKLAETGEFVSYPAWVGKKIARASVETKGREGKTSGDFEVKRLSDAQMRAQAKIDGKPVKNLNVAQLAVLEYMFESVGVNAAGNVEVNGLKRANPKALSKDLAAEAAFEILNEELQNPKSDISEAFKNNQEGLGVALTENFVTEVARDTERGAVKYSLTIQNSESTLRGKEFMSIIGKLAKVVQTGTNTIEDVIENGVINDELVKKFNIPESFKQDLVTLLQYAHDNGILDGGAGVGFIKFINESEIIPNEDIPNSALTKRSPIEQLTEYAADVVKIGQQLGREVMESADVQLLGFFNRLLDPAKKKKDTGKPAKFYSTLQTMLKSLKSKNVPAGLDLSKVSLMNKNKGLMKEVAKIQGMDISKAEKLQLVKEQGLNKKIQEANIHNKLLLQHIVKTMINMVNNGDIKATSYLQLLQAQTNAVNGLRALSGLTFITFKDGPQGNMKGEHLADNASTMGRLAELAYENLSDTDLDVAIEEAVDSHDQWLENRETLDFIDVYGKNNPNKELRILGLPTGLNDVYHIDGRLAKDVIPEITQRRKNKQSFNNLVNKENLQNAKELIEQIEEAPVAFSKSEQDLLTKQKELNDRFNDILERKTGIESFKTFSDVQAEIRGRKKGKFKFFIAPAVDDFRGLVNYAFSGKGKQGEIDKQWLEDNLMTPYAKGISAIEGVRQQIKRDFKEAVKSFPKQYKLLNKTIGTSPFTYDHAVRVYLWQKAGVDTIPGLSKKDTKVLQDAIQAQPELIEFANSLLTVARRDEWIPPTEHWVAGTVLSDLNGMTEKIGRKEYLAEFIENADIIFTKDNLNKIEAAFGKNHREAIEDSLYSMINGTNRSTGASQNKTVGKWLNWINGSTGAIMFFNRRSALLQMLSTVNFINYSDNNPVKAAAAFANQKQYWKDFAMIFNSDKLKERRGGLQQDVSSDEIASIANKNNRSPQALLARLLKLGFTPTQIADSMAIASGGATFYRNRVNTYVKGGMDQAAAEKQAFLDFSKISDETQQSSDPALVSQIQRSVLGRIVFAFQNTPMQMTRLMKKDALDLINGRGDWKAKVSRIAYYGAIQNAIFSSLQSALFALIPGFDDEDDEDLTEEELIKRNTREEGKITRALNSMLDTLLRGSGVYGAILASAKNVIREYNKQEEKGFLGDHSYTILSLFDISPPIGSKARKINTAIKTRTFEKDAIAERGWAVTAEGRLNLGPNWSVLGNVVSATTNVPLDRVVAEVTSVAEAFNAKNTAWQRVALGAGWKTWDVGVENEVNEKIKEEAKARRKEEGKQKAKETRERKKQEEKDAYDALSPQEKAALRTQEALEKRQKALERRKKKAEEQRQ